jgi:hypothetical protein
MEVTVKGKGRVAPHPVDRNVQQFRVAPAKLREDFVVKRHLIATDRAPVGRIERQDYWLTRQIRQRRVLIGVTRSVKSGEMVPAAKIEDIFSPRARMVSRPGSAHILGAAIVGDVDCNQFRAPQWWFPTPVIRNRLTYFYDTQIRGMF